MNCAISGSRKNVNGPMSLVHYFSTRSRAGDVLADVAGGRDRVGGKQPRSMVRRYYNLPSLTALAVFEASARHMNFNQAGMELNVTRGAVSRQIKALEEELTAASMQKFDEWMRNYGDRLHG